MRALLSTISLLALMAASPALAQPAQGRLILESRLRYETVDQDGLAHDASAVTVRTRLGYETPSFHGFKGLIEGENVTALVDDFNSTTNGKTFYPIVSDPNATELNRAQISWTGDKVDVVFGRQRLILNNARFIGNSGFRQNEQTYDALKATYHVTPKLSVMYAYVGRVNRVFGPQSTQGEWHGDTHLAQIDAATPIGQLSVYGHLLEFDNAPMQSLAEGGARMTGAHSLKKGLAVAYEVEYARQRDYRNNSASFNLDYVALSAELKSDKSTLALGLERLDGNGVRGFQTPLATLHAFQGWADVFLTTPATGIRDINLSASKSVAGPGKKPIKLQFALHQFDSADGSTRFGKEVDASVSTPLTKNLSADLSAASFSGDGPAFADRTKIWVTLEFKL